MKRYEVSYGGAWGYVSEKRVKKVLGNLFSNTKLVLDELEKGYTIYTPFAQYRLIKSKGED